MSNMFSAEEVNVIEEALDYIRGMSNKECQECIAQFHDWYSVTQPPEVERDMKKFIEFMEEVYNHTYCDVCGVHYSNDDPCQYH